MGGGDEGPAGEDAVEAIGGGPLRWTATERSDEEEAGEQRKETGPERR